MPTILETDIGEIEMPDEWSADQIKDWAQSRLPTIREGLKKGAVADLASRVPRDLAIAGGGVAQGFARGGDILASPSNSVARNLRQLGLQAALSSPLGEEKVIMEEADKAAQKADAKLAVEREKRLAENTLYQFGIQAKEDAREFYATNPLRDASIPSKLSAAATSTIPVIAAAPLGPVAMAAVYGAMSGQQGAEEAIEMGRPDLADEAYLAYAGLGALSEAALGYPMALIRGIRAARRAGVPPAAFGEMAKRSFPQLVGQVAKESGKASVREAVQESTEQLGQNVAARDVVGFDPKRELSQGVREAAIYGGAVGGLFGGGFGAAQVVDARRAARRAEQDNQPANQIDRLLRENRLDLRPIDPLLADIQAREAMRPENAQRTVVPAMLDQPQGWAVGEDGTRLSDLTLPPASPAPAPKPKVADYFLDDVEQTPVQPPRRRSITPAPESPRFRPPPVTPNVPTPPVATPETPKPTPPVAPPLAPSPPGTPPPVQTPPVPPVTDVTPSVPPVTPTASPISGMSDNYLKANYARVVAQILDYGAKGQQVPTEVQSIAGEMVDQINQRGIKMDTYSGKGQGNTVVDIPPASQPTETPQVEGQVTPSVQTVETQLDLQPTTPNIKLQDASSADISRVDRAKAAVVAELGSRFGDKAFRGVSPDLDDPSTRSSLGLGEDSRRAIETAFGQKLVFFDSEYPVNGLILSDIPGTIFLNVRSRRPLPTVIFHEMMEWLRLNSPADFANFMQVIIEEAKSGKVEEFGRMIENIKGGSIGQDEVLKEMAADLAAYESQRPDFWNRMAKRLGQAFIRIGQKILSWLNGHIQSIRGFETSEYFKDVERVRDSLADAMARFVQQSGSTSTPTGESRAFFQLEDIYKNEQTLREYTEKPFVSKEEAASLRQQAGARAALVPDEIADEIRALDSTDAVEKRMASLLEFVLRMHGLAPALEIQRILADPNIEDNLKDAAISAVLRAIEHVQINAVQNDDRLKQAEAELARVTKRMGKITGEQLIEAKAKETAERLIIGYRAYLTAQAATMPADQNIAAARQQVIRNLEGLLDTAMTMPDATMRAMQAIAKRIGELPVALGPAAVIDAIRSKNILKGVVGDSTIDLLLDEKPGGLAPLLLNPQTNELLLQLAELQKKAAGYAKQVEVFEQAFRGTGEVKPVELKKWAETYRKYRNKQQEAHKAIAEMDKQFREADESVQVYSRTKDILDRLQGDTSFKAQFQAVVDMPGGSILKDIVETPGDTRITTYTSPLPQKDEDGKVTYNKYRVLLAPDRQADEQTMREMALLVHEIDDFLAGDVTPIQRKTWTDLRDFIRRYQLIPMFATNVPGWSFETGHGIVELNPFAVVGVALGGRARAPRTEMEKMTLRGSDLVNTSFRVGDQVLNGYRLIRNNREYGDEVSKIAVLNAVKSHGWDYTRIDDWNEEILNPIIASGQSPGQMRLGVGDYIPGTGIKVTKEDMEAARLEKRFSQAIVQTTQGTAKNLPPLLRDNPVLVEDTFAGQKTLRRAFGTGPLTMARRFAEWAMGFSNAWNAAGVDRRRLITDGNDFRFAALGYVTTTNPEYERKSPLNAVYEEYTARALTDEDQQVQSLDQLIDRLAEIAVQKDIFPDVATAMPQIEQTLLKEIDQAVQAYVAQIAEHGHEGNTPQAIVAIASAKNAFTTARRRMVAPDTFYDYTLTSANDRIAFVAGGYQMFQSKQVEALQNLQQALENERLELERRIDAAEKKVGKKRAYSEVQKQTAEEQEKGELRFTYIRLLQHKRVIDKLIDDLSKLVVDVRDPNDAAALLALSRFQSTLSSGLLASPMAIANNYFGGGVAAAYVTMLNLGRARWRLPGKSIKNMAKVMARRLLASYPSKTLIGKFARSHMPLVNQMARMLEEVIAYETFFNLEAEAWGLRAPPDMRNRLKAAKELKGTAGQIISGKTPMIGGFFNRLESLPILRQFLIHLRDLSPRVVDEQINQATAETFQSEAFGWLKLVALKAFKAREELAKKTGADIGDFTKQENLLTPEELELHKSHGYRDLTRLRQLFQLVGSLEGHLLDYYRRHQAAPEGEKASVPFFTDPAAEGSVLFDMEAHGNIPTTGFTPPSMAGVGQSGVIKRLLFMFKNYVLRSAAQLERLPEKDLRDPKGWREAYGFWAMFAALVAFLFAGILATEVGVPLTKVVTGRAPSRVTAANVVADPDAAIVARYVGMALGNNFPYYGKVVSEMLGNPGYGSWWDAANLIPIAGLVRDTSTMIKRMGQTGDPIFPGLDFVSRWMPPLSPAIRLWPGMEGDIQAKNAARALRVVGPSQGMELAGGGGTYAQTPVTPEIRRLLSAAYSGDEDGIRRAFAAAVAAKEEMGSPDPVRAVKQSLAAATPARRVYGRSITEAEERGLIGQMTGSQKAAYAGAHDAFELINRTLGTNYRLTSTPPKLKTSSRRRRQLRGRGSRLPSIRRGRSRRSPFGRYRIRRLTGRRRRRNPSFSIAA